MAVHSIHIFDRRGKTLFTKQYAKSKGPQEDEEYLSEQRKLVFGMLFSLREMVGSLAPESNAKDAGKPTTNNVLRHQCLINLYTLTVVCCC